MDWETLDTDLSAIDINDNTYRITTDQSLKPLAASIGGLGLLNPPFLIPTDGRKFTVVSGFKRVAACRQLGFANIRARRMEKDVPRKRLAEIAVGDNASQRSLNLVEQSRALNLLSREIENRPSLEHACRRLGLPDHISMRDKILRICQMPDAVQQGILEDIISLNTALMLEKLEGEGGVMLADMFRELHLSHSKQREILTNLQDICQRDVITVESLLSEPRLRAFISDPETNQAQKAAKVRHHFRSMRFPLLTRAEENFRKASKKLSLGKNVRLKAPAVFESRDYLFTIAVKELSDLENGIETLQNTLDNTALKKILALKKI